MNQIYTIIYKDSPTHRLTTFDDYRQALQALDILNMNGEKYALIEESVEFTAMDFLKKLHDHVAPLMPNNKDFSALNLLEQRLDYVKNKKTYLALLRNAQTQQLEPIKLNGTTIQAYHAILTRNINAGNKKAVGCGHVLLHPNDYKMINEVKLAWEKDLDLALSDYYSEQSRHKTHLDIEQYN